jgi:hypothetical protein
MVGKLMARDVGIHVCCPCIGSSKQADKDILFQKLDRFFLLHPLIDRLVVCIVPAIC